MCCCLITWCCARKQKVAEETQEHTYEEARKHVESKTVSRKHVESEGSPEGSENCSFGIVSAHNTLHSRMATSPDHVIVGGTRGVRADTFLGQQESYSSSASSVVSSVEELEDSRDMGTVHFGKNFVGVMTKQCYSVLNREGIGAENELKYNRDGKFVAKCCFVGRRFLLSAASSEIQSQTLIQRQMLKSSLRSLGRLPHGSILLLLEHNATIGDLKREFSKRFRRVKLLISVLLLSVSHASPFLI